MHFAFPSLSRTGCLVLRSGSRDIPRYEHAQIVSNCVSRFGITIADDCFTTEATRIESQLPEGKITGFLHARRRTFESPDRRWPPVCLRPLRSRRARSPRNGLSFFDSVPMRRGESSPANLNTRAGNEPAELGGDISTWMLLERLQCKHALGQNSW